MEDKFMFQSVNRTPLPNCNLHFVRRPENFTSDDVNIRNSHSWAYDNPYGAAECKFHHCFSVCIKLMAEFWPPTQVPKFMILNSLDTVRIKPIL